MTLKLNCGATKVPIRTRKQLKGLSHVVATTIRLRSLIWTTFHIFCKGGVHSRRAAASNQYPDRNVSLPEKLPNFATPKRVMDTMTSRHFVNCAVDTKPMNYPHFQQFIQQTLPVPKIRYGWKHCQFRLLHRKVLQK